MKVIRPVKMKVDRLEIGDRFKIPTKRYGKIPCTVVGLDEDGNAIAYSDILVDKAKREGETEEDESCNKEMQAIFNRIFEGTTEKWRHRIIQVGHPTLREMYGMKVGDDGFEKSKGKLKWFKDCHNRQCTDKTSEYFWYWLDEPYRTKDTSSTRFCVARGYLGIAYYYSASYAIYVRPRFLILNPDNPHGDKAVRQTVETPA